MTSVLKQIGDNLQNEIGPSVVQSKIDTTNTEVRVKDIGVYRHPVLLYKKDKNPYLDRDEKETDNFTKYSLYSYPTKSNNLALLPFLSESGKVNSEYNYREFVNWVSKEPDILQKYYDNPKQYCADYIQFNDINHYERGRTTSLVSLAIAFEDTETGVLYTGITPIYDKPFSAAQLLKSETVTTDSDTEDDEEILEVEEFTAELTGTQLTTDDWSISLENTYSATWYTLPLLEYANENIFSWQVSLFESMGESSDEWFEVTGKVKTSNIKYNDSLTIKFPFGIKSIPWKPSITEDTSTEKYLESYDPETNTVTVELRSFGHGPLSPKEISEETGLSGGNGWIIRPKTTSEK